MKQNNTQQKAFKASQRNDINLGEGKREKDTDRKVLRAMSQVRTRRRKHWRIKGGKSFFHSFIFFIQWMQMLRHKRIIFEIWRLRLMSRETICVHGNKMTASFAKKWLSLFPCCRQAYSLKQFHCCILRGRDSTFYKKGKKIRIKRAVMVAKFWGVKYSIFVCIITTTMEK